MKKPVYLDYAATTPVDPLVAEKMMNYLTPDGAFGNPASRSHRLGWQAEEAVDIARNQVAEAIGADALEIVWTSGATESDNLAIKGVFAALKGRGNHVVTVTTEHKAILDCCQYIEEQGAEVTYLAPASSGLLDVSELAEKLTDQTILVSIMAVNNETGVIQDLAAI
ncbi:MAG: aminotransferase class V-fold PLP-dependent enzyme, partial [Kangiellaceae bacterium]|nr:aminotransferase class V-fold PLP-dependent enzyme [Kangiellaceae bacterium]